MSASVPAKTNLYAKLAAIAADLGPIQKDAAAPAVMGGFAFLSHGTLLGHLRSRLAAANVAIVPMSLKLLSDSIVGQTSGGKDNRRVVVELEYHVVNGDDPTDRFSCTWIGEGLDTADKATQKAATSAEKYLLFKLFKVSDKDDPDALEAEPTVGPNQRQADAREARGPAPAPARIVNGGAALAEQAKQAAAPVAPQPARGYRRADAPVASPASAPRPPAAPRPRVVDDEPPPPSDEDNPFTAVAK